MTPKLSPRNDTQREYNTREHRILRAMSLAREQGPLNLSGETVSADSSQSLDYTVLNQCAWHATLNPSLHSCITVGMSPCIGRPSCRSTLMAFV